MSNPSWRNTHSMQPTLHSLPQFFSSADSSSSSSSSSSCSSSSSSPSFFHHFTLSNSLPLDYSHNQELTQPWSQLLSAGVVDEDGRCTFSQMQHKKVENWVDQVVCPSASVPLFDLKQESAWHGNENFQTVLKSSWNEILPGFSTKSSMISSDNSMLNFNSRKAGSDQPNYSAKCNRTAAGSASKKARVQATTFKVRKEKLGDRIAALHQLVSPFGKTDTASVLLEATGYIRFLQGQIEALSSPYLGSSSSSRLRQPVVEGEPRRDLRSRGLCLVPVSCMQQVCSNNAADFWAPAFGGGLG